MTQTINCRGKLIDLETPKIMGILNMTPDSFFDGGKNNNIKSTLLSVKKMLSDGADIIDIGGVSSRPNADYISEEEELQRVLPILKTIHNEFPETIISVDTFRSEIAKRCIENGASIINDISGGQMDKYMFQTIASLNCPYILMHMRGNSKTMQTKTDYKNVVIDVIQELSIKVNEVKKLNICDIIIDPGFGFSKTLEQNYQLLHELNIFKEIFTEPILVGISRKSMIYKKLESSPSHSLNGTTALHMTALMNGAKILRVHDVKEAKEVTTLYLALNQR